MDETLPILQHWDGKAQLQLPGGDSSVPVVGADRDPQHLPPRVCQHTLSSTDGWLLGEKNPHFSHDLFALSCLQRSYDHTEPSRCPPCVS